MIEIKKIYSVSELPVEWDSLIVSYFQRKEFLQHCEKYNPCLQRYYCLFKDNFIVTGAIVYSLSLDIFTFIGLPSPIKMKIIGIPCSVSAQGIIGDQKFFADLIIYIHNHEKGFHLSLNLEKCPEIKDTVNGRTLPTIIINNNFKDWNHYKESLRSDYRRRFLKIRKLFAGVEQKRNSCIEFTPEMYNLYLQVLKRSKGKLETLSKDFFQNLPLTFSLTSYYYKEKLIGWYISATCLPEYYFFLGGIDYKENNKFNTYFNMLSEIVKEGIQKRAAFIDLGQTAEIPKMRLGGKIVEKRMLGFHTSKIINTILKKNGKMLEYKTKLTETNTMKQVFNLNRS